MYVKLTGECICAKVVTELMIEGSLLILWKQIVYYLQVFSACPCNCEDAAYLRYRNLGHYCMELGNYRNASLS
jgi:hypothetical protein